MYTVYIYYKYEVMRGTRCVDSLHMCVFTDVSRHAPYQQLRLYIKSASIVTPPL